MEQVRVRFQPSVFSFYESKPDPEAPDEMNNITEQKEEFEYFDQSQYQLLSSRDNFEHHIFESVT